MCVQIIDQALLTHIRDDRSWGVIRALPFFLMFGEQILEDLTQHFRINSNLCFQWFRFIDCKVIAVKNIENTVADVAIFGFLIVGEKIIRK